MDFILSSITKNAVNYAIRSGVTITGGYATQQFTRLMKATNSSDRDELGRLRHRLESKIKLISPSIDMIELISARGNTSLESAVSLTKSIRLDIQTLGARLSKAAAEEELARKGSSKAKPQAQSDQEVKNIIRDIRDLLQSIEDAVPLISLAITTSGVTLSANLPVTVSPSRLLQASTFLSAGDSRYATTDPIQPVQVGPSFTLSMYMLFLGHANPQDEESLRSTIWKEVIHKARMKLVRVPLDSANEFPFDEYHHMSQHAYDKREKGPTADQVRADEPMNEFAYQLSIIEDLDDDRVHTFDDESVQPGPLDDVALAGIREAIPIHEIAKIFYADTGKILNIGADGETNNPILLLKRDVNAAPPRRTMQRDTPSPLWEEDEDQADEEDEVIDGSRDNRSPSSIEVQIARDTLEGSESTSNNTSKGPRDPWRLPKYLDPEWIAFEVYSEGYDSDTETDPGISSHPSPPSRPQTRSSRQHSVDPTLTAALSKLQLETLTKNSNNSSNSPQNPRYSATESRSQMIPSHTSTLLRNTPSVTTSLSLLEMLVRLTSLQQFQQASHLTIPDELLNFFLQESSTTGAGPGDSDARKRIRLEARERVGFDPYDESPVKRRGEQYQYHQHQRENGIVNSRVDDGDTNDWKDIDVHGPIPISSSPPGAQPLTGPLALSPLLLRSREHSPRLSNPHSPSGRFNGSRRKSARSSKRTSLPSTPPLPGQKSYSVSARYEAPDSSPGPSVSRTRRDMLRENMHTDRMRRGSSPLVRSEVVGYESSPVTKGAETRGS